MENEYMVEIPTPYNVYVFESNDKRCYVKGDNNNSADFKTFNIELKKGSWKLHRIKITDDRRYYAIIIRDIKNQLSNFLDDIE